MVMVSWVEICYGAILVVLLICGWKICNWVWLKPRRLEKLLRQNGFDGNSYRLLFGDSKEMSMMVKQANSKPMPLSHDIVSRAIPFSLQAHMKYGKNFFTWFGPQVMLHITEPELVREVLTKSTMFLKPKSHPLVSLLADGITSHNGDRWVKHRKILNPAFHPDKLKNMLPAFRLSCNKMLSKWEDIIIMSSTEQEGKRSCELDVWAHLQTMTGDVISRSAFGSSYEEGRRIFELQREQADLVVKVIRSLYLPGWRFLPTKSNKRMKEIHRQVQELVKGIIDKRIEAMKRGSDNNYNDLLGIMLQQNFKESEQYGNHNDRIMTMREIIEDCKTFYLAGQETSAVLLVWTMVLLSKHQDWQTRAREEVLQVFGDGQVNYDELNQLKVVSMIIYEVLRLYPPGAELIRATYEDASLNGITIPEGVFVSLPIMILLHSQEIWGEDAKEFKPERFSEGVTKATNIQFAYIPFGWGPRNCIGQNFAMLETKMALCMILQRFSFELSPSYTHAPYLFTTLQPQYGAHLVLTKL